MSLLLLEALGALVLLVFIVWWTMFSGRKKGELTGEPKNDPEGEHATPFDAPSPSDKSDQPSNTNRL